MPWEGIAFQNDGMRPLVPKAYHERDAHPPTYKHVAINLRNAWNCPSRESPSIKRRILTAVFLIHDYFAIGPDALGLGVSRVRGVGAPRACERVRANW